MPKLSPFSHSRRVLFPFLREANNKLIIEPKPDSLLRVLIHIKKVNKKVNMKEQVLPTFERVGFVAVEWGGTIH